MMIVVDDFCNFARLGSVGTITSCREVLIYQIGPVSMNSNRFFLWVWLGLLGAGPAVALELEPCELHTTDGVRSVQAQCGRYQVAENPAQADGRTISLRVAKVPARAAEPQPDPLFIFAGGPGQAATEAYPLLGGVFHEINRDRDIILIDQRGTGGSNPLRCPMDMTDFTQPLDLDQLRIDVRKCLSEVDGDPRYYTTTIGMSDYDQVRAVLGYEQINLWGGSYGTRAAQVYLRQYPQRVRSLVLDSVAPPQLALGSEHGRQLERVLRLTIERCLDDQACHKAFPNLEQEFISLREELERNPRILDIPDPRTGETVRVLADRNSLAVALRFLSYGSPSQALMPLLVHQAAAGDVERLLAQGVIAVSGLIDQLARGMELSVSCAEDIPFMGDVSAETNTLIGMTMIDAMRVSCEVWPRGEVPEDFHQPFPSDVPALLLAGEFDPVTPPAYAALAAEQYSQHQVIVVPGRGHLVSHHGCMPELLSEFINNPDPAALDTSCVERIGPEPFFIRSTGPQP
ncbi:MAG: alpha/beta fold hydrolase [Wenzhouxiangellaceae bacterium]